MLSSVHGRNFLSFKTVDFTIPSGVTLIDGWNFDDETAEGSGKSAILNLICWTAFGELPKEVNVDDVIKFGEKFCAGELHFDDGVKICRTRKPNDLRMYDSSGVLVKGKDAKETQQLIEDYLNVTFKAYCQSSYFAQNYNKKFLMCNQEEKGKVLSEIQNISIFDKARKAANDRLKDENEVITGLRHAVQVESNKVLGLNEQKSLVQSFIDEKINSHSAQLQNLESRQLTQSNLVFELMGVCNSAQQAIYDLRSEQDINKDMNDLSLARPEYSDQLAAINFQISQVGTVLKAIKEKEEEGASNTAKYKYNQLRLTKLQEDQDKEIGRLTNESLKLQVIGDDPKMTKMIEKIRVLEEYAKNPTKACPSCGTELKNVDLTHTHKEIQSLVDDYNESIENAGKRVLEISSEIKRLQERTLNDIQMITIEMEEILIKLEKIGQYLDSTPAPQLSELTDKKNELSSLIYQIDITIKSNQDELKLRTKLESDLTLKLQNLKHHEVMLAQYANELSMLKQPDVSQEQAKIDKIDTDLNLAVNNVAGYTETLKKSVVKAARLEQLKEGFKEIKSYIFTNALNELSFKANQYLQKLFEVDAKVKFYNEDLKIEEKLILNGQQTSIGLLSGGQFRRYSLAIDLSLADMSRSRKVSKFDILQLDEYFKDLHESSMEKCLELLKDWKSPVLIVEHNTLFKNIVDKTFFVKLENGTSYASEI